MTNFTAFCDLHQPGNALVLPNCWDVASAKMIALAGARAIATTSSGVSWALGRPDGSGLSRDEMIAAADRIVRSVNLPVTVDVESGYGHTPDDFAQTVKEVARIGAVGANLEDSSPLMQIGLNSVEEQCACLSAARSASDTVFINARIDTYLRSYGPEEARLDETIRRANAYVEAGAHGIFVPGVTDIGTIRTLTEAISAPVNIMALGGAPSVAELNAVGVARVSVGPFLQLKALAVVRELSESILEAGDFGVLSGAPTFGEINAEFPRKS